jgi:histidine triad (HIT) family protein
MYNHEPQDYDCPFCQRLGQDEGLGKGIAQSDMIYDTGQVTAFIAAIQRTPNDGNVLVIPNQHYENLYDMPSPLLMRVHELAKAIAVAQKAVYDCDGVSLRQHNEPGGSQDVWHYHVHVTPRYQGDNFYPDYDTGKRFMPSEERAEHARKLRDHLKGWLPTGMVSENKSMVSILKRQIDPVLEMLAQVIDRCPAQLWLEPAAGSPYWQQVYHTIFFVDFWLRHEYRKGVDFRSMTFDKKLMVELDQPSPNHLTQTELAEYLVRVRSKLDLFFAELDDASLLSPIVPTSDLTYTDAIVGQIRHVQYHMAQCNTILGQHGVEAAGWLGYREDQ